MGVVTNIVSGIGSMYAAPVGSPVPTRTFVWPTEWSSVGYTYGGIRMEYTPHVIDYTVDQERDPVGEKLISERVIIQTKISEVTAENLCRCIAAQRSITQTQAETIMGSGTLPELMVGFEGFSPGGWGRTIYLPRAIQRTAVRIEHSSDALTLMDSEWLSMEGMEIFDGVVSRPSTVEGLLVSIAHTADGYSRTFSLPERIMTDSDPIVSVNGLIQDELYSYSVIDYAGYTSIVFTWTPSTGDRVIVWYQKPN